MNGELDPQEPALSALYERYFTVVPADTPDLLDAAHALRYQVYCVEHAFEDPTQQSGSRERAWSDPPAHELRRLVPHMSLRLMRGVCLMAAQHDIETVCAAMSPPLLRLLERFGLLFQRLGPSIEYHGRCQQCVADSGTG